jgi:hypothetical protein
MKKFIAMATVLVASASAFAFQAGMTTVQINAEVAQRVAAGETAEVIAAAAKTAGVSATAVQASLVAAGKPSAAVFSAMVGAGFDAGALLPPTAAGGNQNANNNPGNGFNGVNNNSFGQSRASTVGGGGKSSVSGS